jgi:hypothetical protein
MNKKMIFLMLTLLLWGTASMNGQEISDDPIMVVTGSVVNTGTLISKGPIDLRTNPAKDSQINNTATGDIQTPALTVGEFTLLNNEGNLCVGCVAATPPAPGSNIGDYDTQLIGSIYWTIENISFGESESDYFATVYNNGETKGQYTAGDANRGYYYTNEDDETGQAALACKSLGDGWHVPSTSEWETLFSGLSPLEKEAFFRGEKAKAGIRNATEWAGWNVYFRWWVAGGNNKCVYFDNGLEAPAFQETDYVAMTVRCVHAN